MRTFCGFIGWFIGMLLGFLCMNLSPVLSIIIIIGGIPIGRYIGGCIEKSRENQTVTIKEVLPQKTAEEYEREAKERRKWEAMLLVKRYPEATKKYFWKHWGIITQSVSPFDITDEQADVLLSHKSTYESDERALTACYHTIIQPNIKDYNLESTKEIDIEKTIAIAKQRKEQAQKTLLSKVNSWRNIIDGNFHYTNLLDYYPTTCDFEANEEEWSNRWLIWNFKNTPGKISQEKHRQALNKVIPMLISKLVDTFGRDNLKFLTLVCIPASSATKTEARYKEFSERLCQETGMANAYYKMEVLSSTTEKKMGGNGISPNNISFDRSFFKGRYILLFDDIITKGDSMSRFKNKMKDLGAIPVGGISIGRTRHNR